MERSEPALVPEWLRCSGNVTGGGTLSHQFASSSTHSDDSPSFPARNRTRSSNDKDSQHPFLDRSSSSNCRRTSGSNGSAKHPYSSFARNHRDKNREKDKERSATFELLDDILTGGTEKSSLRRSQSLAPRRTFERRPEETRSGPQGNPYAGNGLHMGGSASGGIKKASFDKDFPSLGAEEKQAGTSIVRVSSPVLSSAVQNLPIGTSLLVGSEKWTSALAEVPTIGSSPMVSTLAQPTVVSPQQSAVVPPQQSSVVSQSWGSSNAIPGLNMAEALSQAPPRTRATPQAPDKNQRLEELAKKQSKQLIPVTPSLPKALVSISSDKSKQPKGTIRATDSVAARSMQQQQLQHSNQQATQSRGGQVKYDGQNSSHVGKFLVLKPSRENGATSTAKDASSPTNNPNGKVPNGQISLAPPVSTALAGSNMSKVPTLEKKAAALTLHARSMAEKKVALAHAQSRSDFFNLMRKKTSPNNSSSLSDSSTAVVSLSGKADKISGEGASNPASLQVAEKCDQTPAYGGGDGHDKGQSISNSGGQNIFLNGSAYPDEEETAFLRSLGWEENGDDEGLTEEEINAFYEEYMKLRPSLKVGKGIQTKCPVLSESHSSNSVAASCESYSGVSESEALA